MPAADDASVFGPIGRLPGGLLPLIAARSILPLDRTLSSEEQMTGTAAHSRLRRRLQLVLAVVISIAAVGAAAQPPSGGQVLVPGSSLASPGDLGVRPHTNTLIFVPQATGAIGRPPASNTVPTHPLHHKKKPIQSTNVH
jgi:hypothetical protein